MKKRTFYCDNCRVRFGIDVESDYDEETFERDFIESMIWISRVMTCPVCRHNLEEE